MVRNTATWVQVWETAMQGSVPPKHRNLSKAVRLSWLQEREKTEDGARIVTFETDMKKMVADVTGEPLNTPTGTSMWNKLLDDSDGRAKRQAAAQRTLRHQFAVWTVTTTVLGPDDVWPRNSNHGGRSWVQRLEARLDATVSTMLSWSGLKSAATSMWDYLRGRKDALQRL